MTDYLGAAEAELEEEASAFWVKKPAEGSAAQILQAKRLAASQKSTGKRWVKKNASQI